MSKDTKIIYMDEAPPNSIIERAAANFNKFNFEVDNAHWTNDKSEDFYKGMFAAIRISLSGVKNLEDNKEMTLDDLGAEFSILLGQIANKILKQ